MTNHHQFFTPLWAAERILQRFYPNLTERDVVIDPTCGDGRFLMALPRHVGGYGVEIDPRWSAAAQKNSGRPVLTGDFTEIELPCKPTLVIGNPPFKYDLLTAILERCYEFLDYEREAGFILPVYMFQTAATVRRFNEKWTLEPTLMPRNMFKGLENPLMFAKFRKDKRPVLINMFLYEETDALESLRKDFRQMFVGNGTRSSANLWRDCVELALTVAGGRASLSEIYDIMETNRPTDNGFWREQIRKVAGKWFTRVDRGVYELPVAA